MDDFAHERKKLVEYLSVNVISSAAIRRAFLSVPRERFVPEKFSKYAYRDSALPNEQGQTISQPRTIAEMLELLEAKEGMRVLEVGSGTGYVLALISIIAGKEGKVFGVELSGLLAKKSAERLADLKISNVEMKVGDGSAGWTQRAPFDRILISCACPFVPKKLFEQLKEGGRIVAPVGDAHTQVIEILQKIKGKPLKKTYEGGLFVFVPMKGKGGF